MISVLASNAIDRNFEPASGKTKYYKICICFLFAKHEALGGKGKDWLAGNQYNVSEWSNICLHTDCCFSELAQYISN